MTLHLKKYLAAMGLALAASGTAHACDLELDGRSQSVADYHSALEPCLDNAPEGYRVEHTLERQFLELINEERAKHGLEPYKERFELARSARVHSFDMGVNKFFEHAGPDGRSVVNRVTAFDRRAVIGFASENIAKQDLYYSGDLPEGFVPEKLDGAEALAVLHKGLMDSPGHRKNILSKEASHAGIGVVRTDQGIWVTQVFVDLVGTLAEDVPMRVYPGDAVSKRPYFRDWAFKSFHAEYDNADDKKLIRDGNEFTVGKDFAGDFMLSAKVERAGPRPNTKVSMRLMGPVVTVGS